MSIANDIDLRAKELADISHLLVIDTGALECLTNPWDHGLNEARINLALRNIELARDNLKGLLAKKPAPRILTAAE